MEVEDGLHTVGSGVVKNLEAVDAKFLFIEPAYLAYEACKVA